MPRPKKSESNASAVVKIEKAFWQLLKTEKYSDITVLRISQESGTNRNAFYYHYKNIDDMARKAFLRNADKDVSRALIAMLLSNSKDDNAMAELTIDSAIVEHSRRIMLCAGSDSPYLNSLVYDQLKKIWFDYMSIREDLLSTEEKIQVRFIFAGLVAVLGSQEIKECPLLMSKLAKTDIGKTFIATIREISTNQLSF